MPAYDATAAAIAAGIEARLRAAGTPERAAQEKRYLKSTLEHFGATVREAVRYLSQDQRDRIMAAYKSRTPAA